VQHRERHGRNRGADVYVERADPGQLEWTERGMHDAGQKAGGDHQGERGRKTVPTSAAQSASHDHALPGGQHEDAEAENAVDHARDPGFRRTLDPESHPAGHERPGEQH
jgi:hypothetical protein